MKYQVYLHDRDEPVLVTAESHRFNREAACWEFYHQGQAIADFSQINVSYILSETDTSS